jgi:hypothetical protein
MTSSPAAPVTNTVSPCLGFPMRSNEQYLRVVHPQQFPELKGSTQQYTAMQVPTTQGAVPAGGTSAAVHSSVCVHINNMMLCVSPSPVSHRNFVGQKMLVGILYIDTLCSTYFMQYILYAVHTLCSTYSCSTPVPADVHLLQKCRLAPEP